MLQDPFANDLIRCETNAHKEEASQGSTWEKMRMGMALQMALRGEPAGMGAMPPDLAMATSAGWAWALVLLGALKLGRLSSQRQALDYGHLEVCPISLLCSGLKCSVHPLYASSYVVQADQQQTLMICPSFMAIFKTPRPEMSKSMSKHIIL